nr:hypothetical protein [uncultured Gellertiella sp.]
MQLIDPTHKFYRPLWVRVLIVAVCAAWFGVELLNGKSFWLVIVGALTLYSAYVLLFRFPASDAAEKPDTPDQP